MFIPKVLRVITKEKKTNDNIPLCYITYVDEKGKLRKETSWKNWGKFDLGEFDNEPISGFKMENVVQRSRDWFGSGRNMFRIQHPKGVVFEISANNFGAICESTEISFGEIKSECVLAWDKTELALIPTCSEDYQNNLIHTDKIVTGHTKPSDLVIGKGYQDRNGDFVGYYIGKFPTLLYSSEKVNKNYYEHSYITSVKFKRQHLFLHSIEYSNGTGSYLFDRFISDPKVYESTNNKNRNDVTISEFTPELLSHDRLLKLKNYAPPIFPLEYYGELTEEKIIGLEKWVTFELEEYRKSRNYGRVEPMKFDWSTFPKVI